MASLDIVGFFESLGLSLDSCLYLCGDFLAVSAALFLEELFSRYFLMRAAVLLQQKFSLHYRVQLSFAGFANSTG